MQAADRVLGLRHFVEDAVAMLEVSLADLGQTEPARTALQQADAERRLEPCHRLADARLGNSQARRRPGKTARLDHLGEQQHVVDVVHGGGGLL
ncbi:hypothetical protein SDC9_204837 [bioreactor metagenome]|uniref:Uncharacterized protein n=1 Tax=bioreactor metagenome TaxID=1076179 RepID=A0A645JC77_9ZZZZ